MLPNSQHPPTPRAERAIHFPVTRVVASQLLAPEFRVVLRLRAMDRAAVPEATIDENSELKHWKNKVRFPDELRSTPPPGDATGAHYLDEPQFRAAIAARADGRHHRRALSLGKNIGHSAIMPRCGNGQTPSAASAECRDRSFHKDTM